MTQRTTPSTYPYEPTPVEKATNQVMVSLNVAITAAYVRFGVEKQIPSEEQFRSIIAGYFERKGPEEWNHDLGVGSTHHTQQAHNR